MTAKSAPIGLDQPVQGSLDGVPGVYNSKIDRLAVRTLRREHSPCAELPHCESTLAVAYGSRKASRRPLTLRLTSRAALICSGVLRSGSETLIF
jgi:hypothetical protein